MRILVTGGAGFIGSHLCSRLVSEGHAVTVLDDLNDFYSPQSKRDNLGQIARQGEFRFVQGDITDETPTRALFHEGGFEAVVHLAARAGVRPSVERPLLYERTNVGGTVTLLEACRLYGVGRFVFASSSSVYGATNNVPFREGDLDLRPVSPYAATKLAGENLCYTYSHLYGMETVCLRFFTVYGPRQRPDLAIRKFAERMLQGLPIPVFGAGDSARDYTFVDDTIQGICSALHYRTSFEVFNLGNSNPVSLAELIESLEQVLGVKAKIDRQPDQPGDVPITFADISKAERELGYRPKTAFRDGLSVTAAWLKSKALAAIP